MTTVGTFNPVVFGPLWVLMIFTVFGYAVVHLALGVIRADRWDFAVGLLSLIVGVVLL